MFILNNNSVFRVKIRAYVCQIEIKPINYFVEISFCTLSKQPIFATNDIPNGHLQSDENDNIFVMSQEV